MKSKNAGAAPMWTRRAVLRATSLGLAGLAAQLAGCRLEPGEPKAGRGRLTNPGPLGPPDANGLRLPAGFTSRVIGRANQPVPGTLFPWHTDPDGGAVFVHPQGGWVYVSNREFLPGGVDAIRFDAQGEIVDAYNILPGALSRINCAGGVTPWNTWFSCEEWDGGTVWECDPFGRAAPEQHLSLGNFSHEAAAVDPRTNIIYLTEDQSDSRFYRFVPAQPNVGGRPDLATGVLEVMEVRASAEELAAAGLGENWRVRWLPVPQPNPAQLPLTPGKQQPQTPTRYQVPESTAFRGGEGLWYHDRRLYFTTKGDRRVWMLDPRSQILTLLYDDDAFGPNPVLDSVDNIVATPGGDLVVVEDKSEANQQAVALTVDGEIFPLIEVTGHRGSEVTGPAFSPDGRHFYFSSQRGPVPDTLPGSGGVTFCVTGPWFRT